MRSKILLLLFIFSASVLSASCQTNSIDEKVKSCKYLSFAEAEKILGQKVESVKNSWNSADGKTVFKCHYRAIEKDKTSVEEVNLFLMLEESSSENEAKNIYKMIWESNKHHKRVEVLSGIGNEAYSQSNKPNFHFVMARKGKFIIRLKVNKAIETTSLQELKIFAMKLVEQM